MQRQLLDAEREMVSNFLKLHMTLADCGLEVSPLLATRMLVHNTTDGLPYVEPPLTDEDARARPWVMVRDEEDQPWNGPDVLVCVCNDKFPFVTALKNFHKASAWRFARRATPAEIAAAGLEVTE